MISPLEPSRHATPTGMPGNRAQRRLSSKKTRAAGAALTAGSAVLAMGGAWIGTGIESAHAATTITVTSLNDSGTGTLRDAITTSAAGDTIVFQAGLTGTITLATDLPTITHGLTITGPGASAVTVDGASAHRAFSITGSGDTVSISGLTLAHNAATDDGGAVRDVGDALTLDSMVIDTNSSTAYGGGVFVNGGPGATIANSLVTGNTASSGGGGVRAENTSGALTVTNSSISGNTADGWGGGLYAEYVDGGFTFTNVTFNGNTASSGGGGFSLDDTKGATSITGTTVSGNTAQGSNAGGADFEDMYGGVTIDSSSITGNSADGAGGGLYATVVDGTFVIGNTTISGNTASGNGGGVAIDDVSAPVQLTGDTVANNDTKYGGGGIWTEDTYTGVAISGSTITGNTATRWGGGIYFTYADGSVTVDSTTIAGNTAGYGGGGVQLDDRGDGGPIAATVTVTDSTISGNTASADGGGGWVQWGVDGSTSFFNSTITGNTTAMEGGAIYFYGAGGLTVDQSTVTANSATDTTGGIFLTAKELIAGAGAKQQSAHSAARHDDAEAHGAHAKAHAKVHAASRHEVHAQALGTASATVTGTILWGNSGDDVGKSGNVTFASSLLGNVAAGVTATNAGGNLTGVDPMLGVLSANGGPTQTMALLPGSPAIDAGPNPVPTFTGNEFDQRGAGFPRVVNGQVDIGAFEVQPAPIELAPRFTG